jgi:integrase
LIAAARAISQKKAPLIQVLIPVALSTGMRSGELTSLAWPQVDLFEGLFTVGRAKTAAGRGRVIPMNDEVRKIMAAHREWFITHFGEPQKSHYVFPWGSPMPKDPTRPTVEIKTAWNSIRKAAGVDCRWHDLRHTVATKMAEAGVPETTMLAIMGHMSRKMLERYSHIRMKAKREAVETLSLRTPIAKETADGVPTKLPTVVEKPAIN